MGEENCGNCYYMRFSKRHDVDECHAKTPMASDDGFMGMWPTIYHDDWCGEWRMTKEAERKKTDDIMESMNQRLEAFKRWSEYRRTGWV